MLSCLLGPVGVSSCFILITNDVFRTTQLSKRLSATEGNLERYKGGPSEETARCSG